MGCKSCSIAIPISKRLTTVTGYDENPKTGLLGRLDNQSDIISPERKSQLTQLQCQLKNNLRITQMIDVFLMQDSLTQNRSIHQNERAELKIDNRHLPIESLPKLHLQNGNGIYKIKELAPHRDRNPENEPLNLISENQSALKRKSCLIKKDSTFNDSSFPKVSTHEIQVLPRKRESLLTKGKEGVVFYSRGRARLSAYNQPNLLDFVNPHSANLALGIATSKTYCKELQSEFGRRSSKKLQIKQRPVV